MKPQIARIFMNGRNQAVCLPKDCHFECDEVLIRKRGNEVVISARPKSWELFFKETPLPSEDFMSKREDITPQTREEFL